MANWLDTLEKEGKTLWKRGKDKMLSSSLSSFVLNRTKIQRYGRMLQLQLDSFAQKASFSLLLLGEEEAVEVSLTYQTHMEGTDYRLVIKEVSVSRRWMDTLARQFLLSRPLPIPKELYILLN